MVKDPHSEDPMMDAPSPQEGHPTRFWHRVSDDRVACDICPRACRLREGQRGFCFVRGNRGGEIVLFSYGHPSGFGVDPIEKKPLYHFLPGTKVLSFGTAGCNLACKFCQNWQISRCRSVDSLQDPVSPDAIAQLALRTNCRSVAFTYNDPVIFHEYALDSARACRALGLHTVAVSAGYQCAEPRAEFYQQMDAANIDLKAFSEAFYQRLCGGHLQPVLETLSYIHHETPTWLEITTLLIPGENDSARELESLTQWIVENLGPEVPLHFSAFHPDWKMPKNPATSLTALVDARRIAKKNGLRHVYVGNVRCPEGGNTFCHHCGQLLVGRDRYTLSEWNWNNPGTCDRCGTLCAGVFEANGPQGLRLSGPFE